MNPARSEIPSPLPASVLAEDTERYDVAVVGFGIAGGSAALEAARAGARVLLLERAAVHGGTTCLAGGHFYLGGGTAEWIPAAPPVGPGQPDLSGRAGR